MISHPLIPTEVNFMTSRDYFYTITSFYGTSYVATLFPSSVGDPSWISNCTPDKKHLKKPSGQDSRSGVLLYEPTLKVVSVSK